MDKYTRAFSRALFDSDLIASRLMIAMAEFFWFVMLMWPGNTMARPTYKIMSQVMSEDAWALVFIVSCLCQTAIVLTETYHSMWSRYFAMFNSILWAFVVTSMLLSVYPPPAAIAGEIAIAISAFWIWTRPYVIIFGLSHARSKRT